MQILHGEISWPGAAILPFLPPRRAREDSLLRVVLNAQTLPIRRIQSRAAIEALDDMIGDHPMLGRLARASLAILYPLASPAGPLADDLAPLPMLGR
jgi:hypothetical protein